MQYFSQLGSFTGMHQLALEVRLLAYTSVLKSYRQSTEGGNKRMRVRQLGLSDGMARLCCAISLQVARHCADSSAAGESTATLRLASGSEFAGAGVLLELQRQQGDGTAW